MQRQHDCLLKRRISEIPHNIRCTQAIKSRTTAPQANMGVDDGRCLQQIGVVANFAQHVDAGQRIALPCQDGLHVLAGQITPVQIPLIRAEAAEQHLRTFAAGTSADSATVRASCYLLVASLNRSFVKLWTEHTCTIRLSVATLRVLHQTAATTLPWRYWLGTCSVLGGSSASTSALRRRSR